MCRNFPIAASDIASQPQIDTGSVRARKTFRYLDRYVSLIKEEGLESPSIAVLIFRILMGLPVEPLESKGGGIPEAKTGGLGGVLR